jgi:Sec23/Sec24 trunk domain/Sec23/Sec24 beta-sandwich domain
MDDGKDPTWSVYRPPTSYNGRPFAVSSATEFFTSYSMLNSKSAADSALLPFGALVSPAVCLEPAPPSCLREPSSCTECEAFRNCYCPVRPATEVGLLPSSTQANTQQGQQDDGEVLPLHGAHPSAASLIGSNALAWRCVFCHTWNMFEMHLDPRNYVSCPEMSKRVVNYVNHRPLDPRMEAAVPCYIFVIDATSTRVELAHLCKVFKSILSKLPSDVLVGLVAFSKLVSVYDLHESGAASAKCISGTVHPSSEDLAYLANDMRSLVSVSTAKITVPQCLEALHSSAVVHDELEDMWLKPRAVGVAMEVALSMIRARHVKLTSETFPYPTVCGGHISVCITGPPTVGPGQTTTAPSSPENESAKKLFAYLATIAADLATRVHVFGSGPDVFSVPVLRTLCANNGGSIFLHKAFDQKFAQNVFLTLFRACSSFRNHRGILTVRTSSAVSVSRVIGGVTEMDRSERKETNESTASTMTFSMPVVYPDETFSFYFHLEEDIPGDFIFFQFSLSYFDHGNNEVTRVITRRMQTTGSPVNFLKSVDPSVVGVLMVKRSVLLASRHESQRVLEDLDEQIRDIGIKYGDKMQMFDAKAESDGNASSDSSWAFWRSSTQNASSSHKDVYQLPPVLATLPRILYTSRYGPLLGEVLQNEDDIDCIRALFLQFNVTDCIRMMYPTLVSFSSRGEFEELPLESLAMQSNRILMLDNHTHVFVWSGRAVSGPEYDVYRQACIQRATDASRHRMPAPDILSFNEDSSEERFIKSRLIPLHRDTPQLQSISFPQLAQLQPEMVHQLMSKFDSDGDRPSFHQYYTALFNSSSSS